MIEVLKKTNDKQKIPEWVAIIVKDTEWNLVMVLENENKPWKKAWQYSIPMETVEKWETNEQTINRWLKEELWLSTIKKEHTKKLFSSLIFNVEKDWEILPIKLSVYEVILLHKDLEKVLHFTNCEVKKVELMKINDILKLYLKNKLRPVVMEIIIRWYKWISVKTIPFIKQGQYSHFYKQILDQIVRNVFDKNLREFDSTKTSK